MATLTLIIFGLIIGSFLNVCIIRVPEKKSIFSPARSYCPKCNTTLTWWENIPVLSWLMLRAKCRTCKQSISPLYPFIEILTAIFAVATYQRFGVTPTGALVFALSATLVVISFIDFHHRIIPNRISYPGMIFGLLLGIFTELVPGVFEPIITQGALDSLIGFFLGGGFFYIIGELYYRIAKREGLGGGDIKLMAMTGAILGWRSVVPTIFVGSTCGAVIGILWMIVKRGNRQMEIPFGPWLSLGVIVYLFMDLPFFRF